MIDKNVQVKDNVVLDQRSVVSCLATASNGKGSVTFVPVLSGSGDLFDQGQICNLPLDMKLEQHQMMGEQSPYKQGVWVSEESDLEDNSDDDLIVEEMSDEKFK